MLDAVPESFLFVLNAWVRAALLFGDQDRTDLLTSGRNLYQVFPVVCPLAANQILSSLPGIYSLQDANLNSQSNITVSGERAWSDYARPRIHFFTRDSVERITDVGLPKRGKRAPD